MLLESALAAEGVKPRVSLEIESVPAILEHVRLRIGSTAVRLEVLDAEHVPDSDAVQTRLRQLARVAGVEGAEIVEVAAGEA